jgi:hypothetical protein
LTDLLKKKNLKKFSLGREEK